MWWHNMASRHTNQIFSLRTVVQWHVWTRETLSPRCLRHQNRSNRRVAIIYRPHTICDRSAPEADRNMGYGWDGWHWRFCHAGRTRTGREHVSPVRNPWPFLQAPSIDFDGVWRGRFPSGAPRWGQRAEFERAGTGDSRARNASLATISRNRKVAVQTTCKRRSAINASL